MVRNRQQTRGSSLRRIERLDPMEGLRYVA
jgi:hypothetical protein